MAFLLVLLGDILMFFGVSETNSFIMFLNRSFTSILAFYGVLLKPIAWLLWSNR